jgi:hypothetical protein
MTITLLDAVLAHAANPTTFWIPSDATKAAVMAGDHVKLMFTDGVHTERMWVEVTGTGSGVLDNVPAWLAMRHRDPVSFEPRHIIQIEPQERGIRH